MQVICVLVQEQEVIFDFVQACFRFGGRLAWSQEAVFLEFPFLQGSHSLPALFNEIEKLAEHFDTPIRIAVGEDAPSALAFAHYGPMAKEKLPLEALRYFASPFRYTEDTKQFITALKHKGYRILSDLQFALPTALQKEFGTQAAETVARAKAKNGKHWPGFQFLENFVKETESTVSSAAMAS